MGLLAFVLKVFCQVAILVVIVSALASWMDLSKAHWFVHTIKKYTDPIYKPIRKITDKFSGAIDLAPLVVCFGLMTLQALVVPWLESMK